MLGPSCSSLLSMLVERNGRTGVSLIMQLCAGIACDRVQAGFGKPICVRYRRNKVESGCKNEERRIDEV